MTDSDPWYSPVHLPNGQLVVEVQWNGRQFHAARVRTSQGMRWAMPTAPNQPVEFLPPARDAKRWGSDPNLWRPKDAKTWTWPNGRAAPPVTVVEPIMHNERTRFQAVEEAETADLAAEMQADRNNANAQAESSKGQKPAATRGMKRQLWWLDQSRIKYETIPTRFEDVEGRLMRAMVDDGDERDPILARLDMQMAPGLLRAGISLDMLSRLAEAERRNPRENVLRFRPNNIDLGDYLTAIDWLSGVTLDEPYGTSRTVLWVAARMQGYSWGEIADIVSFKAGGHKLTSKDVAVIYRRSIGEAFDVARGIPTPASLARLRNLEAVQAGNLRARRA